MDNKTAKRTFKTHLFRGVELHDLKTMSIQELAKLMPSKIRRRFKRGFSSCEVTLLIKVLKALKKRPDTYTPPEMVKTHSRSMPILPNMVGAIIGVHNGRAFVPIEIKPEMLGYKLGDFVTTKKELGAHGKPGVGATSGSKFVPLK